MNYDICVIGSKTFLFPFLQFGFKTFIPADEGELRSYLNDADKFGIIYIEDRYCFAIEDIIEKHRNSLTPIFIPIGENENGQSFSQQVFDDMMNKAVGGAV